MKGALMKTILPMIILLVAIGDAVLAVVSGVPTLEQVRNAKVRGVQDGKTVQLKQGVYEGAPYVAGGASRPRVLLLEKMTATGNLDKQAGEERVVLLSASSGGTGENIYVAVFGSKGGKVDNLGTALIGDRVRLRGLEIKESTIQIDVVQGGPDDPACCPTKLARRSYRLESGVLKQIASQVTGTLSIAAIADVEWTLEEINGKPLASGLRPPTLKMTGTNAAGFGGCNRFSGTVKESAPGSITFGPLASTKMACPGEQMSLEDELMRGLGHVTSYTFLQGRLALGWQDGDRNGLLVFRR